MAVKMMSTNFSDSFWLTVCLECACHHLVCERKDKNMIKKPQNTEQELVLVVKTKKKKKKKIPHRPRSVVRELIPCRPLSQRG